MNDDPPGRAAGEAAERLGLLGGTFDPVHVGHLVAARAVLEMLRLDRVLLVVAGEPWQKSGGVHANARDRFAMVEAAVDGVPGLEASCIEIDRPGASYTVDTLTELASPGRELYLIVGTDVAARLDTWVRVDEVKHLATLVVVERPGDAPPGAELEGWRVERVVMPSFDVSSTEIRRRLADGLRVDFEVPAGAVRIIEERGLYTRRDDERS